MDRDTRGNRLASHGAGSPVTAFDITPDLSTFVTGHADGYVRWWQTEGVKPLGQMAVHDGAEVLAVAMHPDGTMAASSDDDGRVALLAPDGKHRWLDEPPTDALTLTFAREGGALYGAGWFKLFRWDSAGEKVALLGTDHRGEIKRIAFTPDGRELASISRQTDSAVLMLDPASGRTLREIGKHDLCGGVVMLSPDGRYLVSTSDDATVDGWRATIDSRPLEGTMTWSPASERQANGRVSARLSRLSVAAAEEVGARATAPPADPARNEGRANPWPEVDVIADRYIGRAGDLGRMELSARPEGRDWRIERLSLVNEAGRIDADGWWRAGGSSPQTKLDVALDVKDAAPFLARMGLPGDVKAAPTKIEGQLAWPGAPDDFAYPVLSGTLRVNVGAGQFTKLAGPTVDSPGSGASATRISCASTCRSSTSSGCSAPSLSPSRSRSRCSRSTPGCPTPTSKPPPAARSSWPAACSSSGPTASCASRCPCSRTLPTAWRPGCSGSR